MLQRLLIRTLLVLLMLAVIAPAAFARMDDGKTYVEEVVAPESYMENASFKLVRGVTNLVTCPGEIPKQIIVTTRDRGAIGAVLGTFKGLGMTVARGGFGLWEGLTFFLPNSLKGDYSPILKPEFVWNPSTPIHR